MSKAEFINRLFRQRERRLRFGPGIFDPILGDTPNVGTASGSAGPFGGFEFFTPAFSQPPLLVDEQWNYTDLAALNTVPAWSASGSGWTVKAGQYIFIPGGGAAGADAKLTTSVAYLPQKSIGVDLTLSSSHACQVQINFDTGLASAWFVKWVADIAGTSINFGGGGVGSDAAIIDGTTFFNTPDRVTEWNLQLSVRVVNRVARVVATLQNLNILKIYTRKIGTPTANTAQGFSFGELTNLTGTTDAVRISGFKFYGFTS